MAFPAPSVSVPSLASQWQFSFQGLTIGGVNPAYNLTNIAGLELPDVRTGDAARPRDPGMFIGLDVLPGREITLTGDMSPDGTSLQHAWNAFATATVPTGVTENPLFVNLPGYGTLVTMARPRKRNMPVDIQFALGLLAKFTVMFASSDPRWYTTPTLNPTVGLPSPTAGFTFPFSFPLAFGSGTVAGVINATNSGNIEMRPVLVITGPCTYPSITNASWPGAPTLQFGVSMATGDQLVIDTDLKTATYYTAGSTAGSTRLSTIQPGSAWWTLLPGSNTIQFLSKDSTSVAGTLTVEYASAYLL